ncbi:hypothetical protein QBC36DRAFT_348213 [Triangularia setosa]|uniref:Uncharacterized protein n=1 Tax=Triangularia setosa TaxID=2587417 RepID=A0AAN6W4J8_9PEZI|nr:hypothetical protein QBC36DRAFT_348213 [Podospora setosa]
MASPTTTRHGGFLGGGSPQLSVSSTSELEKHRTRKKVVFSSENSRYNKMMLSQAGERNRISGSSGRGWSKSRSPRKQKQVIVEHDGCNPSRGKVQPPHPPRSPAPVAFQLGTSVGIRGGSTTLRAKVGAAINQQHQQSHDNGPNSHSASTSKKRTLDVPPGIFSSSRRRLLGRLSRSPSPCMPHRQYEHIAFDNSKDELGQIDELASPLHVMLPSQTGVPRKKRALSVWRLASPPKVKIVGAPEPEVVDSESDDISDHDSDGDETSEVDCHIRGERKQRSRRVPEVKVEQEDKEDRPLTVTKTALPMPIIPGEESQRRDGYKHNVNDKAKKPSEKSPFTMYGERHYSEWTGTWDSETHRIPGAGALFPEGYEPRISNPQPWIYPIRDCQNVFPEAWALGGHFSIGTPSITLFSANASRRAPLLNDNRGGTMSIIGTRKFPDPGTGRMPALRIEKRVPLSGVTPRKPKETPAPAPRPLSTPQPQSNSYLVIDLPSNRSSRYLYSPDKHSQAFFQPKKKAPAASSGHHLPKETGPPKEANIGANNDSVPGPSSSDDSIAPMPIRGSIKGEGGVPASSRAARAQVRQEPLPSKAGGDTSQAPANSTTFTRKSGRLVRPEPPTRPTRQAPKRPHWAYPGPRIRPRRSERGKLPSLISSSPSDPSTSARGAILPHTMSDWKIAPGRIHVAFSTYLTHSSTSPLHLTSTISFQLLAIQPDNTVQWRPSSSPGSVEEEEPRTRIYSVAQGIVRVKLCDQEFPVGPNGIFKVSTGQKYELSSV